MFYCLFLIIFLIVILVFQNMRGMNTIRTICLLIAYFIAITSIILYVSKSSYYYNFYKHYFYLPDFLWRQLFFLNLDKFNIIRLMNFSSLAILVLSVYFVFSFYRFKHAVFHKIGKTSILIYALLQFIIYDPALHIRYYYLLYPAYFNNKEMNQLFDFVNTFTHRLNILIILITVVLLIKCWSNAPKLQVFRYKFLFLCLSYTILSFLYIVFISSSPGYYLKISKIADTFSYKTFHLIDNTLFYQLFPFVLFLMIALICYHALQLHSIKVKSELAEFRISKELSASETTSKIFCHYIKNEILAIQAELGQLDPLPQSNQDVIAQVNQRCNLLYQRIDELHRNTKHGVLELKNCSMQQLLSATCSSFSAKLSALHFTVEYPKEPVMACVDEIYMTQAIHNIISNALDAMEEIPPDGRSLDIQLSSSNHWILITISDTGIGIKKENLEKIFSPFYSSHPYSRHWGIGLGLTYKIIHAHEGKIEVSSTPGVGTKILIMLPNIEISYGEQYGKEEYDAR